MRIIVVDIGNTSVTAGFFKGNRLARAARIETQRLADQSAAMAFFRQFRSLGPSASVLASVVPSVNASCAAALRETTGSSPLVVSHRLRTGFRWGYGPRKTLGADRIANLAAVAAATRGAAIVADFGTATTFDVLSADRTFIGGVIAPGLPLMTDYLARRTALLPLIDVNGRFGIPGRSTRDAMRAGARLGYRGLVREIVSELLALPESRNAVLYATGGYAGIAAKDSGLRWKMDPNLTLKGLMRLYRLNVLS